MQELTIPPQSVSPYTPAGGNNMQQNAPKLGTPIPGMQGGLPAKPGLSVYDNPLAQQLQSQPQQAAQQTQSYGRGEDSMLVHMTPNEVNSLRGLAQQFGGDLTVNPNTGLPEAGWLGKLLPTILGAAGMLIPGAAPWMIAAGVGAGQTALTGSLQKGLTAGLGAFGGASLAGAAGLGGGAATAGAGAGSGITAAENAWLTQAGGTSVPAVAGTAAKTGLGGAFQKFGQTAAQGLPGGFLSKAAPMAAGLGVLGSLSDATAPNLPKYDPEKDPNKQWNYAQPKRPAPRQIYPTGGEFGPSAELSFFRDSNPFPGYAEGGSTEAQTLALGSTPAPNTTNAYDALKARIDAAAQAAPDSVATNFQKFMNNATAEQKAALAKGQGSTILDNKTSGWQLNDNMKAVEDFKANDKAADAYAQIAMTTGFKDPITGEISRLGDPSKVKNREIVNSLGDKLFTLDEQGRWKSSEGSYKPDTWLFDEGRVDWSKMGAKAAPPGSTGSNTSTTTGGTGGGGTGTNTATTLTSANTATTPPAILDLGTTIKPTVTDSSFLQLDNPVTTTGPVVPQITATEAPKIFNAPTTQSFGGAASRGLGAAAAASLPGLVSQYSTSPGPITASRNYADPASARIRAAAAANNKAQTSTTPPTFGEIDFGIPKPTVDTPPIGDYSSYYNGMPNSIMTPYGQINLSQLNGLNPNDPAFTSAREYLDKFIQGGGGAGSATRGGINTNVQKNAAGGTLHMQDGGFVMPARETAEFGNGSTDAGWEYLRKLGGIPIRGDGDGVSDSIRARIGGTQEARVATGETYFPPKAVKRVGGAAKLNALMRKAESARKKANRGADSKLRRGLA